MSDLDPNTVSLQGTRGVCFDDEPDIGALMGLVLQMEGVDVISSTDPTSGAQQAQQLIEQGQAVGFVTVDGRRGGGAPYDYTRECLAALGKLGILKHTAVVLVSGDLLSTPDIPDDIVDSIDARLPKPFMGSDLILAIKTAIVAKREKIKAAQDQDQ